MPTTATATPTAPTETGYLYATRGKACLACLHQMVALAGEIEADRGSELSPDEIASLTLTLWSGYKGSYPPR